MNFIRSRNYIYLVVFARLLAYIMPVVQKLYDACKVCFSTQSNGPISEEALAKVISILDDMIMWVSNRRHNQLADGKFLRVEEMVEKGVPTNVINIQLQSSICTCTNATDSQ